MIYPKIFEKVSLDQNVKNILGTNPLRFYPFGQSPQQIAKTGLYAVWQTTSGNPQNTLHCPPKSDIFFIQIDVYGDKIDDVRNAATALIEAIQKFAWVDGFNGEDFDFTTKRHRYSFNCTLIQPRS